MVVKKVRSLSVRVPRSISTSTNYRPRVYKNQSSAAQHRATKAAVSPVSLLVFAVIAFVLANRDLYIAIDDENYIEYFTSGADRLANISTFQDFWLYIIEEPGWALYTAFLGQRLGPEGALKFTIGLSAFLFLYSSAKLARNWTVPTLLFLVHDNFATQMFFNQIRQGFALSIFLFSLTILKRHNFSLRSGLSACGAIMVHTSCFALLPASLLLLLNRRLSIFIAVGFLLFVAVTSNTIDIYAMVDFGRRQAEYTRSGTLNVNFYIVWVVAYTLICYFLYPETEDNYYASLYTFTVVSLALSMSVTFVHEVGGRLLYNTDALLIILVALRVRQRKGILALGVWLAAIGVNFTSMYFKAPIEYQDTIITRWQLILFSTTH